MWGVNPFGHHLTSVVLHAVNSGLVVQVTVALAELRAKGRGAEGCPRWLDWRGAVVAGATAGLLFGIHPIHLEAVAWVAERKDVLCAMFYLRSVLAYIGYLNGRAGGFWICLLLFALALMSKPMAVSLPLALFVLDWYPGGRIATAGALKGAVVKKLPFFVLSVGSSVITLIAQHGAMSLMKQVPLGSRLVVAGHSLFQYAWKTVWPLDLSPFYPYPERFGAGYVLLSAMGVAICAGAVMAAKRHKALAACAGYYVITLMPVLGIVQVGAQSMSDRYAYLPCIGLFVLAGLAAARLWDMFGREPVAAVVAALIFVSLTSLTVRHQGVWKDDISMWTRAIEREPAAFEYVNRGKAFLYRGMRERASKDFEKARLMDPENNDSIHNLFMIYLDAGDFEKAEPMALPLAKRSGFGVKGYLMVGALAQSRGTTGIAVTAFKAASDIDPLSAEPHNSLADAYEQAGLVSNAIDEYRGSLRIDSLQAGVHMKLGRAYMSQGKKGEARAAFAEAMRLDPQCAEAKKMLEAASAK